MRWTTVLLWLFIALQCACATVFLWDMSISVFGIRARPMSWQLREFMEITAILGLSLGAIFGFIIVLVLRKENRRAQQAIRSMSGALSGVLEEHFTEWNLTPAEREVAWLTFKGFTNQEIADLRGTREGTIKAQNYAIFRKAGVKSRTQLLAHFMDDLLENVDIPKAAATEPALSIAAE